MMDAELQVDIQLHDGYKASSGERSDFLITRKDGMQVVDFEKLCLRTVPPDVFGATECI